MHWGDLARQGMTLVVVVVVEVEVGMGMGMGVGCCSTHESVNHVMVVGGGGMGWGGGWNRLVLFVATLARAICGYKSPEHGLNLSES